MNKGRVEKILFLVFFSVGIIMLIAGGIFHINNSKFISNAGSVDATITRIETSYDSDGDANHHVEVRFEVNGKQYRGVLSEWNSKMYEGGLTKVYYNKNNPNDFRGSGLGYIGYIIMGLGFVFSLVGIIPLIILKKRKNSFKRLKSTGKRVDAKIDSIDINISYTINGRNPYRINCSYTDPYTNKIYFFKSENIWFNVEVVVANNNIITLPVYMDQNNPSKYYVDIEGLKQYLGN